MKTRIILAFLLSLITLTAWANSNIERMETIGEEMNQLMYQAMVDEIAANGTDVTELKAMIPDSSWDQPMRDAAGCILDKYQQKIGKDGVEEMLSKMEALLPELRGGGMAALENASSLSPSGISDDEAIEINQSCGMMALMQERMMNDGFMGEVMKLMRDN